MVTWRSNHIPTVAANIDAGQEADAIPHLAAVWQCEEQVPTTTTGQCFHGLREVAMFCSKLLHGQVTTLASIDVQHHDSRGDAGCNGHAVLLGGKPSIDCVQINRGILDTMRRCWPLRSRLHWKHRPLPRCIAKGRGKYTTHAAPRRCCCVALVGHAASHCLQCLQVRPDSTATSAPHSGQQGMSGCSLTSHPAIELPHRRRDPRADIAHSGR